MACRTGYSGMESTVAAGSRAVDADRLGIMAGVAAIPGGAPLGGRGTAAAVWVGMAGSVCAGRTIPCKRSCKVYNGRVSFSFAVICISACTADIVTACTCGERSMNRVAAGYIGRNRAVWLTGTVGSTVAAAATIR